MIEEVWLDVVGYEDVFQISNLGRVFSKRSNSYLKLTLSKTGYPCFVSRIGGRKSPAVCFRVHRLVAIAFIPNPLELPCVNHLDGDKTNSAVSNLEWTTHSGNVRHARDAGLCYYPNVFDDGASSSGREKLTREQVEYIRSVYRPYDKEFGARPLARRFGLDHSNIRRIASGRNYVTRAVIQTNED